MSVRALTKQLLVRQHDVILRTVKEGQKLAVLPFDVSALRAEESVQISWRQILNVENETGVEDAGCLGLRSGGGVEAGFLMETLKLSPR